MKCYEKLQLFAAVAAAAKKLQVSAILLNQSISENHESTIMPLPHRASTLVFSRFFVVVFLITASTASGNRKSVVGSQNDNPCCQKHPFSGLLFPLLVFHARQYPPLSRDALLGNAFCMFTLTTYVFYPGSNGEWGGWAGTVAQSKPYGA